MLAQGPGFPLVLEKVAVTVPGFSRVLNLHVENRDVRQRCIRHSCVDGVWITVIHRTFCLLKRCLNKPLKKSGLILILDCSKQ